MTPEEELEEKLHYGIRRILKRKPEHFISESARKRLKELQARVRDRQKRRGTIQ